MQNIIHSRTKDLSLHNIEIIIDQFDGLYILKINKLSNSRIRVLYKQSFSSIERVHDVIAVLKNSFNRKKEQKAEIKSRNKVNVKRFIDSLIINDVFYIKETKQYYQLIGWKSPSQAILHEITTSDKNVPVLHDFIGDSFNKIIKSAKIKIESNVAILQR